MKTIFALLCFVGSAFCITCEVQVAPLVIGEEEKNVPALPQQLAYATDNDGKTVTIWVRGEYASGSKFWYEMPDGHEILFGVP